MGEELAVDGLDCRPRRRRRRSRTHHRLCRFSAARRSEMDRSTARWAGDIFASVLELGLHKRSAMRAVKCGSHLVPFSAAGSDMMSSAMPTHGSGIEQRRTVKIHHARKQAFLHARQTPPKALGYCGRPKARSASMSPPAALRPHWCLWIKTTQRQPGWTRMLGLPCAG